MMGVGVGRRGTGTGTGLYVYGVPVRIPGESRLGPEVGRGPCVTHELFVGTGYWRLYLTPFPSRPFCDSSSVDVYSRLFVRLLSRPLREE